MKKIDRLLAYSELLTGHQIAGNPMFDAILTSRDGDVSNLIDQGEDPYHTNGMGMCVLTFAIFCGNDKIACLLLESGALPTVHGVQQALAWAKETKKFKVVDALAMGGIVRDPTIHWNS